jgi:hypothetical protein
MTSVSKIGAAIYNIALRENMALADTLTTALQEPVRS